jgi:multidrug efflux pump subunit AcrA (membrane-fusion protein)
MCILHAALLVSRWIYWEETGTVADDPMATVDDTSTAEAPPSAPPGGSARRSRRWYRRPLPWIAIGTAVVLVVGGGAFLLVRGSARAAAASTTYQVAATTLQQTVSATGTIEPATQAALSFSSAGTVTSVDVAVGQKVVAGEHLAAIDPSALESAVTLAQAQVDQAGAQVSASAGGSATETASAAAQLASAQARLTQAEQALAAATLVSPIAGVVASVDVAVGDQVGSGASTGASSGGSSGGSAGSDTRSSGSAASSATTGTSAAITVISTGSWVVDASVGSADLPQIAKGLQVQITPTGARQAVFGTVQSAGIVASSSSGGTASFPVVIAVTGTPTGLYAGTSASVSIIVKQISDALVVPTQAVHTVGGTTEVTVVKGGKDVETPVTIGEISGARTQITKGLSAGDEVVVPVFTGSTGNGTGTGTSGRTGGFGGGGFGGGGFGGTGGGFGGRNGGQGGQQNGGTGQGGNG